MSKEEDRKAPQESGMKTDANESAAAAARAADAMHPELTFERVFSAATDDEFAGFCTACGARTDGIEPDARECACNECGANRVYGCEQLILENLFR